MNARGQENLAYYQNAYVRAFLYMLMLAEGTTKFGYYTLFGGSKISSLSRHPNIAVKAGGYVSTAAGAFQFLIKTWNDLVAKLGLTDFSESAQIAGAIELIREKNALEPLLQGDLETTVYRVRKVWASLPGAGYGQGEKSPAQIRQWFNAGLGNSNNANTTIVPTNSAAGGITAGAAVALVLLFIWISD
jgi:muramidase (phage lysozyme)